VTGVAKKQFPYEQRKIRYTREEPENTREHEYARASMPVQVRTGREYDARVCLLSVLFSLLVECPCVATAFIISYF
jgi:hypothetical protein